MFLLRIIVFLILVSLLIILAYPLLIIYDISSGGDGFGICSNLINCVIPITEGPRLLIILIASFFVLVFLLRIIMKFINSLNTKIQIQKKLLMVNTILLLLKIEQTLAVKYSDFLHTFQRGLYALHKRQHKLE